MFCSEEESVPRWLYASQLDYWYWTMDKVNDSDKNVWTVEDRGTISNNNVDSNGIGMIRPVINVYKDKI